MKKAVFVLLMFCAGNCLAANAPARRSAGEAFAIAVAVSIFISVLALIYHLIRLTIRWIHRFWRPRQ